MWLHFYIEDNIGVSIIDSIPHCHTENALKKEQKQEMWLRFYILEKMEYLSSIVFHSHTQNAFIRGKMKKCGFVSTGLRPIYVIFFEFLPISFQMKNTDDMILGQGYQKSQIMPTS